MGAEESILKSVEVGEAYTRIPVLTRIWTIVAPARRIGTQQCTVFIKEFEEVDENEEVRKFLDSGIQILKSLRHPSVVKYVDGSVTSSLACLLTERVQPYEYWLDVGLEKDEVLSGLCNVFDAVAFLHGKAGLSHNNISPGAVFIASDGSWKLGGFECSQRLENCLHWCQTEFAKSAKDDRFIPPEDKQMMYNSVPPYARDVYGLGKLVDSLLPILQNLLDDDQKTDVMSLVDSLTMDEAAKRPSVFESNWKYVFRNDLYDILDFLRNLPLKDAEEKAAFFQTLTDKLHRLSPIIITKRLSRYLLSRFVLLEPTALYSFLPQFLTFKEDDTGIVSAHLFKQYVVPELKKVFCVHETAVRLALLTHFDLYCHAFDENTLQELILPELLLGMKDTDETIVAASMRCLADLVPLLGADIVTGVQRNKYFFEGRPRDIQLADIPKLTSVKDAVRLEIPVTPCSMIKAAPTLKEVSKSSVMEIMTASNDQKKGVQEKDDLLKHEAIVPTNERSSRLVLHPSVLSNALGTLDTASPELMDEEKEDLDWVDWDVDDSNKESSNPVPSFEETIPIIPASGTASVNHPMDTVPRSPPLNGSAPSQSQRTWNQGSVKSSTKELGAEYDVKAIDLKPKSGSIDDIDDLFKDMVPKFTPTRPSQIGEPEMEEANLSASRFQPMQALEDDEDVGWDDAALSVDE